MDPGVKLEGIPQVALTVDDIDRAVAFYSGLGLRLLFRTPQMAALDCGSTRVLLGTHEAGRSDQRTFLYFRVADIHLAHDTLRAWGVKVEEEPHAIGRFQDREVWLSTFFDPDGTLQHLISEVPVPALAARS